MYAAQSGRKTLYVTLSAHGFGHMAQLAPILTELSRSHGRYLNIVIQTAVPADILDTFFQFPYQHIEFGSDPDMIMANALEVLPQQTHRAYLEFHENLTPALIQQVRLFERARPDLVLSNVSYTSLAAAQEIQIPNIGLCSLNWADIYSSYCNHMPKAKHLMDTMLGYYNDADEFLIPTPGMPMSNLSNSRVIGTLARLPTGAPPVKQELNVSADTRLVFVSMGGFALESDREQWPQLDKVIWIDASSSPCKREDIVALNSLKTPLIDLLAQSDLAICKPGYGLFAECTVNHTPVLYIRRDGWPEEPCLVDWLTQNNNCAELDRQRFCSGQFGDEVLAMLETNTHNPYPYTVRPFGVADACERILKALWG